ETSEPSSNRPTGAIRPSFRNRRSALKRLDLQHSWHFAPFNYTDLAFPRHERSCTWRERTAIAFAQAFLPYCLFARGGKPEPDRRISCGPLHQTPWIAEVPHVARRPLTVARRGRPGALARWTLAVR